MLEIVLEKHLFNHSAKPQQGTPSEKVLSEVALHTGIPNSNSGSFLYDHTIFFSVLFCLLAVKTVLCNEINLPLEIAKLRLVRLHQIQIASWISCSRVWRKNLSVVLPEMTRGMKLVSMIQFKILQVDTNFCSCNLRFGF